MKRRRPNAGPACGVALLAAGAAWPACAEDPICDLIQAATAQDAAPEAAKPPAPRQLNPSGRTLTIVAPLKDGAIYLGDVEMRVLPDDRIEIAAGQVLDLLKKTLDPDALEPLRAEALPGAFLPPERLAALGLPIAFDPRVLELSLSIPPAARSRQAIGISDLDRETYGDFAQPAKFAAFLNLAGSTDYVHKGAKTGLGDPLALIDGAVRYKGVVLESEGTWSSYDGGFTRNGTRLVYDDARHLNRWVVGDVTLQTRGFQSSDQLAGISITKSFSLLDPQRNVAPRGARAFSLDRPSTVEAIVNGRTVRTLRLQPGTYDVSDFPFVQGSNDIELNIVDDAGRREVVAFSIFLDRTQLAPGLSEYSLFAGVRADRMGRGIHYTSDYQAAGFYRYGWRENMTLGANFQAGREGGMVGGETVWGMPLGTLGMDLAASHLKGVGSGYAANITFDRLMQGERGATSLVAGLELRSTAFGSVGQFGIVNPYSVNASIGVNRSFGDASFVGVQLRYAKGRGDVQDERAARLTYGRRLTEAMNVIVDLDWRDGGFASGAGFSVALVRRFGATGSARVEYDSVDKRTRLGYQTSGGRGVGAWSASGNLDVASDVYGFNGSAAYAGNRADFGLAHNTAYSALESKISDQRTSLRASTAIAFADGAFAVGRQVGDGFAIFRPYEGADDVAIEVEPSEDGYYARSGLLGPALYGQISAYSPRTVIVDAPDAPAGFDIGQGALRVRAPYKAGYVATIGSDYGVTVIGRLLSETDAPLTLLAGVAIEQGGEGRRVQVFTNRQGAFGAGGLKAGRWRIEMPGDNPLTYDLRIPESPDGVARVGDLRPVR
ncbi:MAG: fimbrial biogenesis outer membrane usher protein [Caulobacteraceae bacterium]|nr:fimbrial biogenesis outer membrane usher protein [Caulobacteraceae bacterium]